MNTIDLLDKLNFPAKLGLDGKDALFNKKTIMDAYLSAASLQYSQQLFYGDTLNSWNYNDKGVDCMFNQAQLIGDLSKSAPFDLFKMLGADGVPVAPEDDENDTKIELDLNKLKDFYPTEVNDLMATKEKYQDDSKGADHNETESESYTKLENESKKDAKKPSRQGKKKVDKSDVNSLVSEERRRLLNKLDICEDDRIVFKQRIKNNKKDPKISADNYRGSRYWGVSKNKSKWQVRISCSYFSLGHDYS